MKQPKTIFALFFLVYIIFSSILIIDNLSKSYSRTNEITGKTSSGTVRINIIKACNINLVSGFNFISICANITNSSITSVLEPISGQFDFVLRWNRTSQQFDVFSPNAASNSFTRFEFNESYFIFMKTSSALNIGGSEFGDINISLINQFNAPAYPYIFSTNVTKYIQPIEDNVSFMLKWDPVSQSFTVFSPKASHQDFTIINKGEGQFIYLTNPAELKYNKTLLR